jgi:hypothetical protein
MSRSLLLESFQINERLGSIASHFLIALMMVCFAVSIQHLVERVVPGWHGGYIPWLAFLVSLEAMHSRREVRREADLITSRLVYRMIEWVVIALVIKLGLAVSRGLDQLWAELPLWREDFLTYFFDVEYIFVLLLTFIVWSLSGGFEGQLLMLEGDKFLLETDMEAGIFSDRTAVRRQLAGKIFIIGLFMVLFTTLVRWDYQTLWGDRPVPTYQLSYVMLYFLFGFALITLTHFTARRAVWAMEKTPLSHLLGRQWLMYSLLFLLGVTLLAFILPTGYSMGLLATLAYVFNLLFAMVSFLFYLISMPFIYLLNLFLNLTEIAEPFDNPARPQYTPFEPPLGGASPIPWWEALRTILFWALFLAITGYAFSIFFRQNQYLLGYLRKIPGWRYLVRFWQWLSSGLARANRQTRSALQGVLNRLRISREAAAALLPNGFVNPRRLSPRQQVLFFYLMMLRRGQESGIPRMPSQTPFEYEERLENDLPDVDVDLKSMTDAFVEARYSRHPITPDRARHVYNYWERIKRALRLHKKGPGGIKPS